VLVEDNSPNRVVVHNNKNQEWGMRSRPSIVLA
jgi:hypothetical protein